MKSIFSASPALLLAGALLSGPAFAQTMAPPTTQPDYGQATQPYASPAPTRSYPSEATTRAYGRAAMAQPYGGRARSQQMGQPALPQGAYLSTCKDARMLESTLTAFCPKGDGTWQTTQLAQADQCAGGVQSMRGELTCEGMPQAGSSTPPQNYDSSYGGAYGTRPAPATGRYYPPPAAAAPQRPAY